MMQRLTSLVTIYLVAGCAADAGVEDGINDELLTEDAKADAFGVEDWSPDGAAVLKLASTASRSKLEDDVGLSTRVANAIIAKRNTLPDKTFTDLAELDAASYVGVTVFRRMLGYATEHKLFKTALRIPLAIDDGNGNKTALASFNDEARAHGLQGFARYTFVNTDSDYSAKAGAYETRLAAVAAAAGLTIDGEMTRYASYLSEYAIGSDKVCYIGDPLRVAAIPSVLADNLMGDMYSQWAWRYRSHTWFYEDETHDADTEFGAEWTDWDTHSTSVLIFSTNTDSGDDPGADVIAPCRR